MIPVNLQDSDMEPPGETKICPYCAETIRNEAIKCRYCKEVLDDDIRALRSHPGYEQYIENRKARKWSRGLAGFLSFLIPGVGQIYKKHVGYGVLWLFFVSILYGTVPIAGLLVHIACIYEAAVSEADS